MARTLSFFGWLLVVSLAPAGDPVTASVRVDRPEGNGVSHHGSGTVVAIEDGRALVLTNKHVLPTDGEIYVMFGDEVVRGRAIYLGCDDTADLAAVAILDPEKLPVPQKVTPCPPAKAAPGAGVSVVQIGYPHACRQPLRRVGEALLRGGARLLTGARIDHVTVQTFNGDSGSGVFVNGELVGVVWGGDGRVASCVALEDIRRFCATGRRAITFPRLATQCREVHQQAFVFESKE